MGFKIKTGSLDYKFEGGKIEFTPENNIGNDKNNSPYSNLEKVLLELTFNTGEEDYSERVKYILSIEGSLKQEYCYSFKGEEVKERLVYFYEGTITIKYFKVKEKEVKIHFKGKKVEKEIDLKSYVERTLQEIIENKSEKELLVEINSLLEFYDNNRIVTDVCFGVITPNNPSRIEVSYK